MIINPEEEIQTYSDGGARGNPGPAATGSVLKQGDEVLWELGEYIGETTNNQAEYRALIKALEQAKAMGAKKLHCFLDSELLVKQLKREYRVKEPTLQVLYLKAYNLAQQFSTVSFTHIRREYNKHADRLVNEALDKQEEML